MNDAGAVASTTAEPAAGVPASTPGHERHGGRRPHLRWESLALAAFTLGMALALAHYSLQSWTHNYDEDIYKTAGVLTWNNLPDALWNMQIADRGLQRLANWTLGFGPVYFGAPDGFRVSRMIDLACFVSTVIPMWFWVRAFGLSRIWAAGAAALSIAVPWAVITSTFMTENLAYPLATWAMWAIWRAGVRPRPVPVTVALVAIFVACLARAVMMLLLPVLVFVVVACFLRYALPPLWRKRGRLTAWHVLPMAVLIVIVAVLWYLYDTNPRFVDEFTGAYRPELNITWSAVPKLAKVDLARAISGIGILPGIVAVAFVGRTLWRPVRPESFSLAVLAIGMLLFVDYGWMRAGPDERYMMYLAPPLIVAAAVALGRREIGPRSLGLAASGVVILFAFVTWNGQQSGYGYFVSGAEAFHARILLLGIGNRLPDLHVSYDLLLGVAILAACALLGFVLWRPERYRRQALVVGVVLVGGLGAMQVVQALYVTKHFALETRYGPVSLDDRSWVDRSVGGRDGVAFFASRTGADWDFSDTWREAAFWNMTITKMFITIQTPQLSSYGRSVSGLSIDPADGRLKGTPALPRNVLEWQITPVSPLVGDVIARQDYLPMALKRISQPARVAWLVTGNDDAGWTVGTSTTTIRVYKDAPGPGCLNVTVLGPPGLPGTREVRTGVQTVRVHHDQEQTLRRIPLRGGDAQHFADLAVRPKGLTKFPGGQLRGVRITGIERATCS